MCKQFLFLGISVGILLIGCNSTNREQKTTKATTSQTTMERSEDHNETIQFQRTKVAAKRDTLTFKLERPAVVEISLITPDKTGNLRINTIIMPDGQTDGPFGREFEDSLAQIGSYQLIIAESLMQGDPFAGDYHVKIKIDSP